ncbi:MAG: PUA domain-containing protein [Deinococcales bacterium]
MGGRGLEQLAKANFNSQGLGTHILASKNPKKAAKARLKEKKPKGSVDIDQGAYQALLKGKSLLAVGVTKVNPDDEKGFRFSDVIEVRAEGKVVAKGISNYSSESVERIKGQPSSAIEGILGYKDYDELIHRDNLVML